MASFSRRKIFIASRLKSSDVVFYTLQKTCNLKPGFVLGSLIRESLTVSWMSRYLVLRFQVGLALGGRKGKGSQTRVEGGAVSVVALW